MVKKNSQNINYEEEFEKWGIKYIQLENDFIDRKTPDYIQIFVFKCHIRAV